MRPNLVDAGRAEVRSGLQGFDDLLVVRRVFSKGDLQLAEEAAAAFKGLLLLQLSVRVNNGFSGRRWDWTARTVQHDQAHTHSLPVHTAAPALDAGRLRSPSVAPSAPPRCRAASGTAKSLPAPPPPAQTRASRTQNPGRARACPAEPRAPRGADSDGISRGLRCPGTSSPPPLTLLR